MGSDFITRDFEMRKFTLTASICVLACANGALAQDNQIRVVQPDGSVQVIEIPVAPAAAPVPEASPQASHVMPSEPVELPTAEKIQEEEPKPEPAPKKKAEPKPPPEPTRAESHGRIPAPETPPALALPQSSEITRDMAVQLALPYAPPAMSLTVLPRDYNGRKVYVVTFRTETGPHDVLVDVITGEIIKPE
jgi:outer membrane biosynthesis protein TonB